MNVRLIGAGVALMPGLFAGASSAQNYPAKQLRLIVPWAAASGTDLMARMIAQKLGENLGVPIGRGVLDSIL